MIKKVLLTLLNRKTSTHFKVRADRFKWIYFPILFLFPCACVKITDKNKSSSISGEFKQTNLSGNLIVEKNLVNPETDLTKTWIIAAHRIEIKSGARILSNGAPIKFVTDELVAEGAIVETFSEIDQQTNSQNSRNGRDSGDVEFQINELAQGELEIWSRGEAGSEGEMGVRATELPGYREAERGSKGVDAQIFCDSDLDRTPEGGPSERPSCSCYRNGENGGSGAKGAMGGVGGKGYIGGNSGRVTVRLPAESSLKVKIFRQPGNGGLGGLGGEGGPGGAGGEAGHGAQAYRASCIAGSVGESGPKGNRGPTGEQGASGAKMPTCVYRGTEALCLDSGLSPEGIDLSK